MISQLKCDKIITPELVLKGDNSIKANFLSGLFDSDGTFTCKTVKYATTSKKMSKQVLDKGKSVAEEFLDKYKKD
jgi:intein/homing endonuclease